MTFNYYYKRFHIFSTCLFQWIFCPARFEWQSSSKQQPQYGLDVSDQVEVIQVHIIYFVAFAQCFQAQKSI